MFVSHITNTTEILLLFILDKNTIMFTQAAEKLVGSSESSKSGPSETDPSLKPKCCTGGGPGYESPMQAFKNGPREQIMFVALPNSDVPKKPDMLVSVDVNPDSAEFCKVICYYILEINNPVYKNSWI